MTINQFSEQVACFLAAAAFIKTHFIFFHCLKTQNSLQNFHYFHTNTKKRCLPDCNMLVRLLATKFNKTVAKVTHRRDDSHYDKNINNNCDASRQKLNKF